MEAIGDRLAVPEGRWPERGLESVSTCPVCGSEARSLFLTDLCDRICGCAPGQWVSYQCHGCGSAYLDPRPTPDTIGIAYARYYTHSASEEPEAPVTARWPRLQRLQWRVDNGYLNAAFGFDLQPASMLGPVLMPLFAKRKANLDRVLRHLRRPHSAARLLDVGCGSGEFLRNIQRFGWQVEGVEPDPAAVRVAREAGLSVLEGTLVDGMFADQQFDAITLNHVIEHMHEPVESLRSCHRILKPGGTIWIATPNLGSEGCRRFGKYWLGLDPPRHLVLFTSSSLRDALERAGFRQFRYRRDFLDAEYWFIRSVMNERGEDWRVRPYPPLAPPLRRVARLVNVRNFVQPRHAEELVILAKKPTERP